MVILNITNRRDTTKKFQYEVGILDTESDDEIPEIMAKFRVYGDAWSYAKGIANGNVWHAGVVIRN